MSAPATWRWGDPPEPLRRALDEGAVIAIPTESSYGLAVDPRRADAVSSVFRLKGRDAASPLPVVAASRDQITDLGGRFDEPVLERLATRWPAALSLLVPLRHDLPAAAGSGRLAVRIPAHERLRELLESLGSALTATSANRSGRPPILRPVELGELLSEAPGSVIVDDGELPGGNPSTLAGVREGKLELLRVGAVPASALATCLDRAEGIFSAASVEILADESR